MESYKINFAAQTITITKAFEKKCSDPETAEYMLLRTLQTDFPAFTVKRKTHKTPSSYTSSNGETSIRNPFKNLTFEHMEKFMSAIPDNRAFFDEYHFLKDAAAALQLNPYALVRKWFCEQFPQYKSNPLLYLNAPLQLVKGAEVLQKAAEEAKKAS